MSRSRSHLTYDRRRIANAFSRNAQLLSSAGTLRQLEETIAARFDEPRLGQLIAQSAARQAEYSRVIVDSFRAGRFGAANALTRSLLEMTVWICWPMSAGTEKQQRNRFVRLLVSEYRQAAARGATLPRDARDLLAGTTGKVARKPPDFQQMLKDLDEAEHHADPGKPFWVTHAENYEMGNRYVHPSMYGPVTRRRSVISASSSSSMLLGLNALVFGHQYLALSAAGCALAAGDDRLREKFERRYASVAAIQEAQLTIVAHSET